MVRSNLRKIGSFLSREQTKIVETAFWLMLPALLTKITGQLFNLLLASFYGASDSRLNQFFIANTIPELLTTVLMVGTLGTVIIPILMASKSEDGKERFDRVFSSIINSAVLVFTIASLIIIIFADQFIPAAIQLVDPTYPPTPAELNNIVGMMRALILPQLVLGISVFISSALNVYNRILITNLSPLFYNIGRISAMIIFLPLFDFSPWVIIVSTYVGSFMHLFIQLPFYLRLNLRYQFVIDWKNKHVREVLKLGLPRIIVLASDQIGLVVNNFLSIAFVAGPATLNFAKSLYLVIPSLFGFTFASASYPTLSKLFYNKDYDEIKSVVRKTINEIFFLALPFVVTLMILRVPVVRLLFGIFPDTNFTLDNTYQVAWILLFFTFGVVFITARWFVFSLFYAAKDTVLPSLISIGSLVSVITLSLLCTNFLSHTPNYAISAIDWDVQNFFVRGDSRAGVAGISLAMSITYTIEFIILIAVFNRFKLRIGFRKMVRNLAKKFIAAGAMFLTMFYIYKIWVVISYVLPDTATTAAYKGSTTLNLLIMTIITVIPSFMVYFLVCHLLKVQELQILRRYLNPVFRLGGLRIGPKTVQYKD